jgi:hypothetical protein
MATAPIQHKTTAQVVKSDAAMVVPNNALPTVQQVANPPVRVLVLTDAAPFVEERVSHRAVAHVLMFPQVQAALRALVLLLVETTVSEHAR